MSWNVAVDSVRARRLSQVWPVDGGSAIVVPAVHEGPSLGESPSSFGTVVRQSLFMTLHVKVSIPRRMFDIAEYDFDEDELEQRVLAPYRAGAAFMIDGVPVDPASIRRITVARSELSGAQLRAQADARAARAGVVAATGPHYQAFQLAEDVTRQYILGPPGSGSPPADNADALAVVLACCEGFGDAVRILSSRHGGRPAFEVNDEYDVQDLLHAMLAPHFDDVQTEEWTPKIAGAGARVDLVLHQAEVLIETKMTRPTLRAPKLRDELHADMTTYTTHPHGRQLVILVYDPSALIAKPRAFERDIASVSHERLPARCTVVR